MQATKIPWANYSWNPTSGCSFGCSYCYARALSRRFGRSFEPTCHPEKLDEPLKLKKPARIFVDSNGDLFDPAIPDEFIERVFGVMALCQQHTFIVLTKQAKRMYEWFQWSAFGGSETRETIAARYAEHIGNMVWDSRGSDYWLYERQSVEGVKNRRQWPGWPLPNVHLGVTVETQKADERISYLRQTPAAVRFVSAEPLLGPLNLTTLGIHSEDMCGCDSDETWCFYADQRLDWLIIGCETGSHVRPCDFAWAGNLIEQCESAKVPVFVKGALFERFPIQQFPEVTK